MSIVFQPIWNRLWPYFQIQVYDRDGGHRNPRIRIELRDLPPELIDEALQFQMPCVACGRPIHPIRERRAPKSRGDQKQGVYYAPTCPLDVNVACSRGGEARDEYNRIRAVLRPDLVRRTAG